MKWFSKLAALCLVVALSSAGGAFAQEGSSSDDPAPPSAAPPSAGPLNSDETVRIDRLVTLNDLIQGQEREVARLQAAVTDNSASQAELDDAKAQLSRLQLTFDRVAIGDVDVGVLEQEASQKIDWREELNELAAPLLESVKAVTERPRRLAALRESIALGSEKLELTNKALAFLQDIPLDRLNPSGTGEVQQLIRRWTAQRQNVEQELSAYQASLARLEEAEVDVIDSVWSQFRAFLLGRGLTVVLAIVAAIATWLLLRAGWWFFTARMVDRQTRRRSHWYRLIDYGLALSTALIVGAVVLLVLYLREDLLLLALAMVALALLALGIRQYLPQYANELRLLLNIGPVREGERVVVDGLPWRVQSIGMASILENPALGTELRMPLPRLSQLVSRPSESEVWFPSKINDWILLPDGSHWRVVGQDPEFVRLQAVTGIVHTLPTLDFAAMGVTNLSADDMFGVRILFGLDYSLQADITTSVVQVLARDIGAELRECGFGKQLRDVQVELDSAGASSLDLFVQVRLTSDVASKYAQLGRHLQRICVQTATREGWNIPFPQLTVHQPPT